MCVLPVFLKKKQQSVAIQADLPLKKTFVLANWVASSQYVLKKSEKKTKN
jgi:hypothetical protein